MRTFIICATLVALTTTAGHASPGGRTTTGHQLQADFCKLLERGKVEPVMEMFGSNLKSEIDAPVFQRWLDQMASKLGRVRSIEQKTVDSNMRAGKHHLSLQQVSRTRLRQQKSESPVRIIEPGFPTHNAELPTERTLNRIRTPNSTIPRPQPAPDPTGRWLGDEVFD